MPYVISKGMKKLLFFLVALFLLTIFVVFKFFYHTPESEGSQVRIGSTLFSVEIADTEEKQGLGLGGRDVLCDTCGMLFLFDHSDKYAFWMKDMRFPLDILWILDGKVVHIEQRVDFHDQYTVYRPEQSSDRVLEVNTGTCERWGIREGDAVVFE